MVIFTEELIKNKIGQATQEKINELITTLNSLESEITNVSGDAECEFFISYDLSKPENEKFFGKNANVVNIKNENYHLISSTWAQQGNSVKLERKINLKFAELAGYAILQGKKVFLEGNTEKEFYQISKIYTTANKVFVPAKPDKFGEITEENLPAVQYATNFWNFNVDVS